MKTSLAPLKRQPLQQNKMNTLQSEFTAGMESGKKPHPENDMKALTAVTSRNTEPMIRAYWSGYLCQYQLTLGIKSIIPPSFGAV